MGSLLVSKAPHLLFEAFAGIPHDRATLDVFGAFAPYHGDDRYRARIEPLLSQTDVRVHGPIPHAAVPAALGSIDVLVVPSVWIENAPFVIREAFAAGIPVIASDIGGMAEMVADGRTGLLFRAGDAEDLRRAMLRLIREPDLLPRLRSGLEPGRTIEEDARWTRGLYERLATSGAHASAHPRPTAGPSPQSPRTAAIVLNFKTPEETQLAVMALRASRRPLDDLIVVDNGSNDGSAARLRAALPETRVMETGENLGFSGGCNVGIRDALARGAELVLLVNSDVIIAPDALRQMEDALLSDPRVGIVGPVLLSRSEPDTVSSRGIAFSTLTGRMRNRGVGERLDRQMTGALQMVDAVSGCVMLIRREVLDRIGLLDEQVPSIRSRTSTSASGRGGPAFSRRSRRPRSRITRAASRLEPARRGSSTSQAGIIFWSPSGRRRCRCPGLGLLRAIPDSRVEHALCAHLVWCAAGDGLEERRTRRLAPHTAPVRERPAPPLEAVGQLDFRCLSMNGFAMARSGAVISPRPRCLERSDTLLLAV